ncbi:pilus assembly PilX N-terminal domain-containing protein [Propionivibrio soli]|uniref:pilus assembly PilX N-terminal domain-containing protein n=1 Tax=Propionivibrio soli TaxID=2976531 RepID=UPI0021E80723|nr:pilus assembly PilX N-terminal domain-containing protein [Propionivibrio soli]
MKRRIEHTKRRRSDGGFALPSAIFLLVILAGLAAFLARVSTTQSVTSAQDIQGTRAYQAARAGIEWGLYRVLDPINASAVTPGDAKWPNMPDCAAGVLAIEGFTVTVVCSRFPAGAAGAGGPPVYLESGNTRSVIVYRLTATAAGPGNVGSPHYVEREISATVAKCRSRDGEAPAYACP